MEISDRAACQDQRRQKQCIGLDHPLRFGKGRIQPMLQDGQRHIDDGHIDEGHAGGDDGRCQDPFFLASRYTARRSHNRWFIRPRHEFQSASE